MMPDTPINPAISTEVTQTDTPTNGESPAEALGNLYEEISEGEAAAENK